MLSVYSIIHNRRTLLSVTVVGQQVDPPFQLSQQIQTKQNFEKPPPIKVFSKTSLDTLLFCLNKVKKIYWVLTEMATQQQHSSRPCWFSKLTRVSDSICAVCWTLGVRGNHRGCSSHRLDSGGHWVDGKSGWGWTGSSWLYHSHLSSLLALGVWCYPLAIPWFGG